MLSIPLGCASVLLSNLNNEAGGEGGNGVPLSAGRAEDYRTSMIKAKIKEQVEKGASEEERGCYHCSFNISLRNQNQHGIAALFSPCDWV